MSFKYAVAIAAAFAIAAPSVVSAHTGTRLDRERRPPSKPKEQKVWFYAASADPVGPLTQTELVAAAQAGEIAAATKVFHPDAGWRVASDVPELSGIVK